MKSQTISAKQTFYNVAEEKRNRLLDAAVGEFAERGFRKASINTIVRKAGIAKGSIYQYFENKEALFLFVFNEFTAKVKSAVREAVGTSGSGDFLVLIRTVFHAGVKFIDKHPAYFHIYLKVLFEDEAPRREELLAQVRLFSQEYFGPLCREAQKRKEIRSDLSDTWIVFIVDAILDRFFQAYAGGRVGENLLMRDQPAEYRKNRIEEAAKAIMEILRHGLAPAEADNKQRCTRNGKPWII